MTRLKILAVCTALGGGGAEKHLVRTVNELVDDGCLVNVAVQRLGGTYERLLDPRIEVRSMSSASGSQTLSLARRALKLNQLSREYNPDVIWSILPVPNILTVLASRVMIKRARPIIILSEQAALLEENSTVFREPRRRVIIFLRKLCYPMADAIVALSRGVKSELIKSLKGKAPVVPVIPNACIGGLPANRDPGGKKYRKVAQDDGALIIACGRLDWTKDFPTLIDSIKIVSQTVPVRLYVIGSGPLEGFLKNYTRKIGLEQSIKFLGFQEDPSVYMSQGDVFALSSVTEGFGNVIVEAMAAGTPVVATNCDYGPRELISNGKDGLLVSVGDSQALAAAIARILTEEGLADRLRSGGRRKSKRFHANIIAAEYLNLFGQFLCKNNGENNGRRT